MHPNLEKRFVELETARMTLEVKRIAFAARFQFLFNNLAKDMGISNKDLASLLGWEPYPDGGNKVSRGEVGPSPEDCYRLTTIYLGFVDGIRPKPKRCEVCGCPLKDNPQDGCVEGNCCMRPLLEAGQKVAEIFQ